MISITVNGEPRTVEEASSLTDLLEALRLAEVRSGLAVCVNGEVVRQAEWPRITLHAQDELEIVRATQGG